MIETFRQIDAGNNRGRLLQWQHNGRIFNGFWPNGYDSIDQNFNGAAMRVTNGMMAAGNEINEAVDSLKRVEDIYERSASAINRHVTAAWRNLREQAIIARDSHASALNSLNQTITPDSGQTPLTASVAAIERAEVRQIANGFNSAADAFKWVMASEGVRILDAIAPAIELTLFAQHPELAERITEEFHLRKIVRTIANPGNDAHSTADAPLNNRMSHDAIRALAKAEITRVHLRGEMVSDAEKLLRSVTDFTHGAVNMSSDAEAFNFLMGRNIQRPMGSE